MITDEQRQRIVSIAVSQIGVREATGNNDGVPIEKYAGGRQAAWCAYFVMWCYRQAGVELPGNRWLLPKVEYMEQQLQLHAFWAPSSDVWPQPGDLVFFTSRRQSDKGPGRHVGIVEFVDGDRVHTVEGNTGNAVRRRSYHVDSSYITGYGWM